MKPMLIEVARVLQEPVWSYRKDGPNSYRLTVDGRVLDEGWFRTQADVEETARQCKAAWVKGLEDLCEAASARGIE